MARPIRILLLGGDAALWVGLQSALGSRSSQIVVPKNIDIGDLSATAKNIDVVVVVTNHADPDPCAPLRLVKQARLERRTVVIASQADQRTAAEALGMGIGAYVMRGTSADRVAMAVAQVAEGGAFYDAPAASVLHGEGDAQAIGSMMSAARALASALELKDSYTGGHAERVTHMAIRLAHAALLEDAMPSEALEAGFLLHDVGKIGIPESILNKPDKLTDTERRVLNTHPILGERIVAPLGFPESVRNVIRHHHERWDGDGYPDKLRGEDIPGAARLFSIADSIDAMTSIRPYRLPVTFEEAIREILAHSGTQFDPSLAELAAHVYLDSSVTLPI
ncbi:MAG: ribonuclease protein subunit [Actinomycetota bacterium]|jgi:ribonuclease P protein subunit RPR2|nr:ribonuclease protein subunit [Actinomycetota bacterium]